MLQRRHDALLKSARAYRNLLLPARPEWSGVWETHMEHLQSALSQRAVFGRSFRNLQYLTRLSQGSTEFPHTNFIGVQQVVSPYIGWLPLLFDSIAYVRQRSS